MEFLETIKDRANQEKKSNKKLINRLKKVKKGIDSQVHDLHGEVFEEIDCLDCANCCKSISPIITDRDIERISRHLKVKPSKFVEQYLYLDEEQDYVYKQTPCPFLDAENYCSIYSVRPKACAEYPHTDRKKFVQILDLSLKNTRVCPAVFEVFEKLKKIF